MASNEHDSFRLAPASAESVAVPNDACIQHLRQQLECGGAAKDAAINELCGNSSVLASECASAERTYLEKNKS